MVGTSVLGLEVEQVAVNLVVNVGVILLLTQVQTWDVGVRTVALLYSRGREKARGGKI